MNKEDMASIHKTVCDLDDESSLLKMNIIWHISSKRKQILNSIMKMKWQLATIENILNGDSQKDVSDELWKIVYGICGSNYLPDALNILNLKFNISEHYMFNLNKDQNNKNNKS